MTDIKDTLKERGKSYAEFEFQATISQQLKNVLRA
jgi:lambda repressor-like predicted transcriptional regulator